MTKIYSTGMNPADCNALKRAPRVAIFQAFVEMMTVVKSHGHDLTWRVTKVGDELPPGTEAVICSVMLPRSLNCPFALGVAWTMSEALRLDIPLVLYLTDWAFFATPVEFRSIAREGMPYFSKKIGGALQYAEDPELIEKHGEAIIEVCRQYGDPTSKLWRVAQISVPRYTNWGDIKIVQGRLPGANPVCTFDPSPAFLQYLGSRVNVDPPPMESRKRRWLLPSLSNDDRWINRLDLGWNVDRYGTKNYPVVSTEREVQDLYKSYAGALCPPYPHEGSGWWRSRWIHSAVAGSILLPGWLDQQAMGPAYAFPSSFYEGSVAKKVTEAAKNQRERMNEVTQQDLTVMVDQIYEPFKRAGALV